MKKFKRLFAVILSLAMVLGMSLTSFAANPAKITVSLPKEAEDAKVTYVQIVKPDPASASGWAFVEGYEDLGITIDDLLAAGETETSGNKANDNKNAAAGTINTTEKLGAALDKVDMSNAAEAKSDGTIDVTEAGLYVIRAEKTGWTFTRMLAYVAYQEGSQQLVADTKVSAKGAKDEVTKELNDPILDDGGKDTGSDKGESVATTDTVKYKVTQRYPYYDADQKNKKFIITDTLTRGEFAEDVAQKLQVVIKSGNADESDKTLVAGTDYKITRNSDTKITLDLGTFEDSNYYNSAYAGKQVEITYDVKVTEVTWERPLENDVESTTSKDTPAGGSDVELGDPEDNTSKFKIISPSVKADIQKLGENAVKLAGAEFTLYVKPEDAAEVTHVYSVDAATGKGKIEKLENGAVPSDSQVGLKVVETKETKGDEGIALFDSLDAQKEYYVVETKAPEGYSLNTEAYKLNMPEITETIETDKTIDGVKYDMVTTYTVDSDKVTINGRDEGDRTITDTKLASLPSTGGIGTTIFTIGGCLIMVVAAALFFASRRKSAK